MCGLYGYIGKPEGTKVLDLIENLGVATLVRGEDATGFYALNGSIHSAKAPVPADQFYLGEEWVNMYENVPSVLIGHNRNATNGNPKFNINNHPFVSKRFGFIHNGVVANVNVNVKTESDCDSERIFRIFMRDFNRNNSVVNGIARTLKTFDSGNLACAMVDSKDRSLYLFRNIARPLVFMHSKALNVIVFASTKEILRSALKMTRLNVNKMYELEVGNVLKIKEDLTMKVKEVEGMRKEMNAYSYAWSTPTKKTYSTPEKKTLKKWVDKTEKKYLPTNKSVLGDLSFKPLQTSQLKRYKCKICKVVFGNEELAQRHLRKVHQVFDFKNNIITFKVPTLVKA